MLGRPHFLAQAAAPAALPKGAPRPWWEGRPFVAAMIILAFVPLLWPTIPPLVDLGGHMGRYKVAVDGGHSATLQQWYSFRWLPIGNLGVDLLVVPLAKLIGLEPATKLVVMLIPPLTVAGMLWVAREVHNRLPPTVAFALPLAFSHPFMFGFVNFSLSLALALTAFGLWLRLGRLGKTRLRAMLFVPISFIVFFAHTFGWGVLGLLAFSADAVRQHDRGRSWWLSILRAGMHAAALALPLLVMLAWRSEATGGVTDRWFQWDFKLEYLMRVLRDRWELFDIGSAVVVALVPLFALAHPRLTLSRNLAFSGLVLAAGFVLLPRVIFGSAYADMRLAPIMAAIFILAIRFKSGTHIPLARWLALAAVGFMLIRLAATTASTTIAWSHQRQQLEAIDHIPHGARVAVLVWGRCEQWPLRRSDHLGSVALVRKEAFVNDQWPLVGSSLLTVEYPAARWFRADPSQIVRDPGCGQEGWKVNLALRALPREAFDYLWLVDMRPIPQAWVKGWTPVWAGEGSILLRREAGGEPPPATRRTASAPAR